MPTSHTKDPVREIVDKFYGPGATSVRTIIGYVTPEILVINDLMVLDSEGNRILATPPEGVDEDSFFSELWDALQTIPLDWREDES